MADRIEAGFYRARGIAGSGQIGLAETGSPQIAIDLAIHLPSKEVYKATTVLVFGGDAGPYSLDRLRALGWEGDDIRNLDGIDKNDVDVEVQYETFEDKRRMRVQIVTRTTFDLKYKMNDKQTEGFAADVKKLIQTGTVPERLRGK